MVHRRHNSLVIWIIILSQLLSWSCGGERSSRFRDLDSLRPEMLETKLDKIREEGVLRVVTDYNSISYFILYVELAEKN